MSPTGIYSQARENPRGKYQEEAGGRCCRLADVRSNSNLKMLADGHGIHKGAQL